MGGLSHPKTHFSSPTQLTFGLFRKYVEKRGRWRELFRAARDERKEGGGSWRFFCCHEQKAALWRLLLCAASTLRGSQKGREEAFIDAQERGEQK